MTPEQSETLIRVEQKLNDMCAGNTAEHEQIRLTQSDIYDKLDDGKTEMYQALNNRPKWSVVMWLLGGVFAAILILAGFSYNIDERIKNHITAGEKIYLRDTGKSVDLSGRD